MGRLMEGRDLGVGRGLERDGGDSWPCYVAVCVEAWWLMDFSQTCADISCDNLPTTRSPRGDGELVVFDLRTKHVDLAAPVFWGVF